MLRFLRRLAGTDRFYWRPDIDLRDPRVNATLRTFNWS